MFNNMDAFALIRNLVELHYKSKRGRIRVLRWMGEAYHNYFLSPWTVTALLAAMLGLTLTFIQILYSIRCKSA